MGFDRVAGEYRCDFAITGKRHIDHELVARHACDFGELAVQRIVENRTFDGQLFAHEAGAVDDLDGLLRGKAGDDELTAPGEARHQMRLNEAQREAQVCARETLIEVSGCAGTRDAKEAVAGEVARVVVFDTVRRGDFVADNLADFGGVAGRCRPVAIR